MTTEPTMPWMSQASQQLLTAACRALPLFWDASNRAFHFKLSAKGPSHSPTPLSTVPAYSSSLRYAFMVLVGLGALARRRPDTPLPLEPAALWPGQGDLAGALGLGDLALAVWAAAQTHAESLATLLPCLCTRVAAADLPAVPTQDLGWVLTALAQGGARDEARTVARDLLARQAPSGLLTAPTTCPPYAHFNVQVYGGVALAAWATAGRCDQARAALSALLEALVPCQRPDGGWPWVYHTGRGTPADDYPLYAVHQCGMGPMLLRAGAEVCGLDVAAPWEQSLAFVLGENELRTPLLDNDTPLLWRSVRRRWTGGRRRWFWAFTRRGLGRVNRLFRGREINHEARPYTCGWTLYALS